MTVWSASWIVALWTRPSATAVWKSENDISSPPPSLVNSDNASRNRSVTSTIQSVGVRAKRFSGVSGC